MTPTAMARVLIHNAYRKQDHPDIPFIAKATGLPEDSVSDLAAMARPLIPALPAPSGGQPPMVAVEGPPGGQGRHHITAMHHLHGTDGHLLVYIACICGALLRARVAELPRHWVRHTEGLL